MNKMKVVQCWDDGVNDDIRLIEILRRHGAKASFNLNPATHQESRCGGMSERWKKRIERLSRGELNSVYEGFTIANHSMSHPRATGIPLEQWREEVVDARKMLQDWFQQPIRGFVYPYGNYDEATSEVVREAGHVYARTTQNATPCMPPADPMQFHPNCKFDHSSFWEIYERAKSSGGGVFYFWGHSFEMCREEEWADFDAKIARISADPEAEWAELPELFLSDSNRNL
ncbi:polysaccharide deacetylase family protein [Puniceicoccus vermicola]|uniref:Polysaccharide deacetylase family protein n=1 Tax=Puniceicoccus vermicola TaxID=388746 RepID=A0A7X1B073_9BACT|nr:polysaccharide deacetylase family protein [Puniceicoccus vermicola]MBC2603218.1 polysaccharide deacetylase family protein [Puniceicoccus vermicola]